MCQFKPATPSLEESTVVSGVTCACHMDVLWNGMSNCKFQLQIWGLETDLAKMPLKDINTSLCTLWYVKCLILFSAICGGCKTSEPSVNQTSRPLRFLVVCRTSLTRHALVANITTILSETGLLRYYSISVDEDNDR